MSEQAPTMSHEQYVKLSGNPGNSLVDDPELAHAKAIEGDTYETIAQRHGRAAEYAQDPAASEIKFAGISPEDGYGQSRAEDIRQRAGAAMIDAARHISSDDEVVVRQQAAKELKALQLDAFQIANSQEKQVR